MSKLVILYGASASGKGTRIFRYIKHLESLGHTSETVMRELIHSKKGSKGDKQVGIYFKDINLFIYGRKNPRRDAWESVDQYKMMINHLDFFREMSSKGVNVLADTNTMFVGKKQVTGEYFVDELGFSKYDIIFFHQESVKTHIKRLNGRTYEGKWNTENFPGKAADSGNKKIPKLIEHAEINRYPSGLIIEISANVSKDFLINYME